MAAWCGRLLRGRVDLLTRSILLLLAGVLIWALVNLLGSPRLLDSNYGPEATSRYSVAGVVGLIPALLLLSVAVLRIELVVPRRALSRAALVGMSSMLAFGLQMTISYNTVRIPTSDPFQIISAALYAAQPDVPTLMWPGAADQYFSLYSNNIAPAAIFATAMRLAVLVGVTEMSKLILVALAVGNIAMLVAGALTLVAVRRILGRPAMLFACGPVALFIVLSPWLNIPYTDALALPFPIALLLLAWRMSSRQRSAQRWLLWMAYGVVAGLGSSIKPTVVFAAVAFALYGAIRSRRECGSAGGAVVHALAGLPFAVPAALLAAGAFTLFTDLSGVVGFSVFQNKNSFPLTHFMAMGAHGTGGYNYSDVQRDSALSPDIRAHTDLQIFLDRVTADGLGEYLLFLGNKMLFVLGDGGFYQGQDGSGPIDAFRSDPFAHWIQQWYLRPGANHPVTSSVWQASWLVLLILVVVPRRGRFTSIEGAVALALLLLLAFLMLSEARSRYLYIYLPFVVFLASSGALRLEAMVRGRLADARTTRRSSITPSSVEVR